MRYLPLVLLLGIVLNFGCIVVFRLKLDRRYHSQFLEFSEQIRNQMSSFSLDALRRIDAYVSSNHLFSASSPVHASGSSRSPSDVLFFDGGVWDYHFQKINGVPFARVGIVDFSVGSSFPRGGNITAIYPDYVVVDDALCFRNNSYAPFTSSVSQSARFEREDIVSDAPTYQPPKELSDYVSRLDKMRK